MSHKTFGNYTRQLEFAADVITSEPLDEWETYAEKVKIADYYAEKPTMAHIKAWRKCELQDAVVALQAVILALETERNSIE